MSDPVNVSDATSRQREKYLTIALQTEVALEEAIRLLKVRRTMTGDPDQIRQIDARVPELEAALAKVHAQLVAFLADEGQFRPPSASDVEEVKNMVRELDMMVANAVTAQNVLDLAGQLIGRFEEFIA
jgi:hypothetical protein